MRGARIGTAPGSVKHRRGASREAPDAPADALPEGTQTETPYSRSASLSEVFWSVLALRDPMMSAHGTPYVPDGNSFWRTPGMTMLRAGTRPRCSCTVGPDTSRIAVDAVSTTPAPMTARAFTTVPS